MGYVWSGRVVIILGRTTRPVPSKTIRWAADVTIADVAEKHGAFLADANGYRFEDASDWFRNGTTLYHDCPSISVSRGVRRSQTLYLEGVACIRDVERCGKVFAGAVTQLVEKERPKAKGSLVRRAKLFDKACRKLEREPKRVKIRSRDRVGFLMCMQRKGMPAPLAEAVLKYLV